MSVIRIIPRLDIKGPNLVKGIHLEGLRVLGRPEEFAEYYYESGADELMFMDVVASLYERNSLSEIISKTAKKIFVPLTVGGGLRSIEDINQVLRAGADKVCLNTAAIKNPEIIKKASNKFGSSTIVVAIEAIKESNGTYLAYTDNAREYTGVDVFEWAEKVQDLGAGEILITSVDREGTGEGFDIDLISRIAMQAGIPVIAHGGVGTIKHIIEGIQSGGADAVSVASLLHYETIKQLKSPIHTENKEGNTEFLRNSRSFNNIQSTNIQQIKGELRDAGIHCRQ
ncbi:MAG: imidazole glycerol phosphate synthase subunit HisF [Flavobacteriales bacterium]|nr:imidazole glycerol phosphate synthase subunit HisF [Flavobacteriales bacterium]